MKQFRTYISTDEIAITYCKKNGRTTVTEDKCALATKGGMIPRCHSPEMRVENGKYFGLKSQGPPASGAVTSEPCMSNRMKSCHLALRSREGYEAC